MSEPVCPICDTKIFPKGFSGDYWTHPITNCFFDGVVIHKDRIKFWKKREDLTTKGDK